MVSIISDKQQIVLFLMGMIQKPRVSVDHQVQDNSPPTNLL